MEDKSRITIDLDTPLFIRIKVIAAQKRETVSSIIRELTRKFVEDEDTKSLQDRTSAEQ